MISTGFMDRPFNDLNRFHGSAFRRVAKSFLDYTLRRPRQDNPAHLPLHSPAPSDYNPSSPPPPANGPGAPFIPKDGGEPWRHAKQPPTPPGTGCPSRPPSPRSPSSASRTSTCSTRAPT